MKTQSPKPEPVRTRQIHVRFPDDLREWLEAQSRGYRSVQEKIIEIVRQSRNAEERERAA